MTREQAETRYPLGRPQVFVVGDPEARERKVIEFGRGQFHIAPSGIEVYGAILSALFSQAATIKKKEQARRLRQLQRRK